MNIKLICLIILPLIWSCESNVLTGLDNLDSEKFKSIQNKNIALTHFNYINPLPKNTIDIFRQAKKIVVCELNRGQFVDYLRAQFPDIKFYQYNKTQGLPFTTIELTQYFDNYLL